jgi:hypothetical protein
MGECNRFALLGKEVWSIYLQVRLSARTCYEIGYVPVVYLRAEFGRVRSIKRLTDRTARRGIYLSILTYGTCMYLQIRAPDTPTRYVSTQ